jgi:hypothetical protein
MLDTAVMDRRACFRVWGMTQTPLRQFAARWPGLIMG